MASRSLALVVPRVSSERATPFRWSRILKISFAAVLAIGFWLSVDGFIQLALESHLPDVHAISVYDVFVDSTPVAITFTAYWQKVGVTVPAHALRTDATIWRRMDFSDWDGVPGPLRNQALENMWINYAHLVQSPQEWDRMDTVDWDLVPQPIRAMAFMQMIRYWSGYYQTGVDFGLARGTVTNTMNAIVMAESWFDHRAVSTSKSGNRDLGLGQTSDAARTDLCRLYAGGAIDFRPDNDSAYFNPWIATRMVAIWFGLMLTENGGDLDTAVRAYHRGTPLARTGEGVAYAANVYSKRRQFMRNEGSSPTWRLLFLHSNDSK